MWHVIIKVLVEFFIFVSPLNKQTRTAENMSTVGKLLCFVKKAKLKKFCFQSEPGDLTATISQPLKIHTSETL